MTQATVGRASAGKSGLSALRESRGGVSPLMKAWLKEQQDARKRLREALAGGPRSVPELAATVGIAAGRVLWHLGAMRRYGEVVDAGERDRYALYAIKRA